MQQVRLLRFHKVKIQYSNMDRPLNISSKWMSVWLVPPRPEPELISLTHFTISLASAVTSLILKESWNDQNYSLSILLLISFSFPIIITENAELNYFPFICVLLAKICVKICNFLPVGKPVYLPCWDSCHKTILSKCYTFCGQSWSLQNIVESVTCGSLWRSHSSWPCGTNCRCERV